MELKKNDEFILSTLLLFLSLENVSEHSHYQESTLNSKQL